MIFVEKKIFSTDECESIISNAKGSLTKWKMIDRRYLSSQIDFSENNKWIFERLSNFFESETGIEIEKNKEIIHFHEYCEGDYFERHNDTRENRLYSVGVLLNDEFEGGEFKIHGSNQITIEKKAGNAYIFDTRIDHEVEKIFKGMRYSLIWFLQYENIKNQINKLL
jgi:hypothetical protein